MAAVRRATTAEDWEHGIALLHDHVEWTRVAVGVDLTTEQPAVRHELDDLAAAYSDPRGALFLAHLGPVPVGTVALRWDGHGGTELKRMYLRPIARGRGLGDQLVAAVLAEASAGGANQVWLETLPGAMDAAITVYRRHGFVVVEAASHTLAVDGLVRMERSLAAAERCA